MTISSVTRKWTRGGLYGSLVLSKRKGVGEDIPTASQLGAVIHQNTLKKSGRWTPGQGYGVIDVAALLESPI